MNDPYRDQRGLPWLDGVWQDVRYAFRSLRRTPMVSATAMVTFALGIGANTAVFSVVDAVLLRPLTYAEPERLVVLHETVPQLGRVPVGAAEFEEWREGAQSFEQMALMAVAPMILTGAGEPQRLDAARVSASLFPMLGINPALGRGFSVDEEVPGRDRVVMLSDGLWRTRFGADASIVGRTITLNDESYVITGVLPPQFRFPRLEQLFVMGITGGRPQLWMPFAIRDAERGENSFAAVAKLRAGVSAEQARAESSTILNQFAQQVPNPPRLGADVVPLKDQITGTSRDTLALLWAAIIVVLVIACGNIANLLLARATVRRPELAIRGALGARGRTLLRHSVVDSLTIAAVGGACGVLVASWSLPFLLRLAPASVPRLDEVAVNGRALMFAAVVTTATGLLVGLLPARRAAATNLTDTLKGRARTGTTNRRDGAVRSLMVSAQVALSVACLGAAGLVVQSLMNVLRVEPGFEPDRVLAVEVSLSPGRYSTRDARAAFARDALQRMQAIPGVTAAGFVNKLPLHGISLTTMVVAEGTERAPIPMVERPQGDIRSVDAGYFQALDIPLLEGELFRNTDIDRPVALVSAAMAKRTWPGENPIGKRFRLGIQPGRLVEVVGVVGDVRNMGFETNPSLAVYLPYWQGFLNDTSFALRTTLEPAAATAAVRAAITAIDPDVPIDSVRPMDSVVSESVAGRRFQASLLIFFGAVAVMLAGVGVFGVMSYAVTHRSKELGIRLALGASPRSLQQMVLGDVLRLLGAGVAIGVPLAVAAGYALRNMLFGVGPQNLAALAAASGLVVLVGLTAGWLPAHRTTRIDPVTTLRSE
jgi:predicted permease